MIDYGTGECLKPEAVAHLIEGIANDKAVRMKILGKSSVVLCTMPSWVRAEEARALFGVPPNVLVALVKERKVKARKCDPKLRGSAAIFEVRSLLAAIDGMYDYKDWLTKRPDLKQDKNRRK